MTVGRKDRRSRLTAERGGSWASSSQDCIRLAGLLFEKSGRCARRLDGNCSIYALAGIPILFSALRALLIEANSGMYGSGESVESMTEIASESNEIAFLARHYGVSDELRQRLEILYEVRNEIVHPSHKPAGTPHGTPEYLASLRHAKLLQSTDNPDSDFTWIAQLQSHKLFAHACSVIEDAARLVLTVHHASEETRQLHLQSYSRYLE